MDHDLIDPLKALYWFDFSLNLAPVVFYVFEQIAFVLSSLMDKSTKFYIKTHLQTSNIFGEHAEQK
jgi:hypothetical protein